MFSSRKNSRHRFLSWPVSRLVSTLVMACRVLSSPRVMLSMVEIIRLWVSLRSGSILIPAKKQGVQNPDTSMSALFKEIALFVM